LDDYPKEVLLRWASAWYWIASDRAHEFDDVVHCPLRERTVVREETGSFLRARSQLRPDVPDTEAAKLFHALLLRLEAQGENIESVYRWTRSMSSDLQDKAATQAMQIVKETFDRFARGRRARASYLPEDLLEHLSDTYRSSAYEPRVALVNRRRASEAAWLEARGRRTEWDEVLWRFFWEEVYVDPAVNISLGYGEVLIREWWRDIRTRLTDGQKRALRQEQVANIQEFSRSTPASWKLDHSIDEAMILDGLPEFSILA
jgi:hypothetical protein